MKPGIATHYERLPVYGTEHAIATSHPTASAVGHALLAEGANAVDAALAAHTVLCVVEPAMTGLGGDCFILYYDASTSEIVALNGSGYAPLAQPDFDELQRIDETHPSAVTIPGAVDAWLRIWSDYASRSLEELFAPAIQLAENGAPVHSRVAADWSREAARLRRNAATGEVFLAAGHAPDRGDLFCNPRLASALRAIACEGRQVFYEGWIAEDIVSALRDVGGYHTIDDMAEYRSYYVDPISTEFGGHEVMECPPNGQGVIALLILETLDRYYGKREIGSEADRLHVLAEVSKLAYAVRDRFVSDERYLERSAESLIALSDELSRKVGERASTDLSGAGADGNTTYLCAVDRAGNAISFINSLFSPFGSCITAPRSGILLNNRGCGFATQVGHPNRIDPRKRPLQTIIPGFLRLTNGLPRGPFGVLGGNYQATGHADLLFRMLRLGLDPQEAINAPRSFVSDGTLNVEPIIQSDVVLELAARGHHIKLRDRPLGAAQAILIDHDRGVLQAASDPRKDGCALAL